MSAAHLTPTRAPESAELSNGAEPSPRDAIRPAPNEALCWRMKLTPRGFDPSSLPSEGNLIMTGDVIEFVLDEGWAPDAQIEVTAQAGLFGGGSYVVGPSQTSRPLITAPNDSTIYAVSFSTRDGLGGTMTGTIKVGGQNEDCSRPPR